MTMRWNAGSEYVPAPTLVVEPPAETREQSSAAQRASERAADPQPHDTMTFASVVAEVRGPIRADSWLVSLHGKALFVTECQPFMRWFIENNPGAVIEYVTGNVPSALARTAVVNE